MIFHYGYILPNIITTGGTITYSSGRIFHTFTGDGTFTITRGAPVVEIMAIGGGGGGGAGAGGGGGGAGNMIVATGTLSAGTYSVVVGNGGVGAEYYAVLPGNGDSSTFGTILTAYGGGGGGSFGISAALSGGCGGGASSGDGSGYFNTAGSGVVGLVSSPLSASSNLATNGGAGWDEFSVGGAGGGGTSAAGDSQTSAASAGRDGGAGTLYRGHTTVVAAAEQSLRVRLMDRHMAAVQVVWVAVVWVKALNSLRPPLQARQTRAVAEVRPLTVWENRADRVL